jgi:uncharacterized cupin superfamily protein
MIVHWDDVERERFEWEPDTHAWWRDLGRAAGTRCVGVRRMEVDPGKQSVCAHMHTVEEEIVFVLGGAGHSWQDGRGYSIRPSDCIVHLPDREVHTLIAGDDGLDVLVFGTRSVAEFSYLPRTGRAHTRGLWFDVVGVGSRPAEAEATTTIVAERPSNIVNLDEARAAEDGGGSWAELADAAGAVRAGLNWIELPAGRRGPPPHCHSAEEEIFIVLDGEGVLELWPTPGSPRLHPDFEYQEHALRAGHVISRPPGTRIAHSLRAGSLGLTYLAYGTRDTNDVCYYPRSNKIFWRGVGLIARVEPLDYFDGEPEH